jgi:hypothetical protein
MAPYRRPSALLRGSLDRSIAEHRGIMDAARAREGDRAAELVVDHIRVPQRRLEALSEEEFAQENRMRSQPFAPGPAGDRQSTHDSPSAADASAPAGGPVA